MRSIDSGNLSYTINVTKSDGIEKYSIINTNNSLVVGDVVFYETDNYGELITPEIVIPFKVLAAIVKDRINQKLDIH